MCGRFTSLLSPELLAVIKETFNLQIPEEIELRYNIAPTQTVWVIRVSGGHNRLDQLKWGLVPSWSKDAKIGNGLINARSETVNEKPSFRHAIKKNRCIIPVSGFFEWQKLGEKKQPYYIHMADSGLMAFAGIWERWKAPEDGTGLETFSILTTFSNELIAPLHDRMPVILRPTDYSLWLDPLIQDLGELKHLYQPLRSEMLEMHRVTPLMNSPKFTGPECIVPL